MRAISSAKSQEPYGEFKRVCKKPRSFICSPAKEYRKMEDEEERKKERSKQAAGVDREKRRGKDSRPSRRSNKQHTLPHAPTRAT